MIDKIEAYMIAKKKVHMAEKGKQKKAADDEANKKIQDVEKKDQEWFGHKLCQGEKREQMKDKDGNEPQKKFYEMTGKEKRNKNEF